MATRLAFRLPIVLLLTAIQAGCGLFDFEEREPWRAQAEAACFARGEVKLSPLIQKVSAIEGKGICGLDRPLRIQALADGQVRIGSRSVVLSCPMTAALERWVAAAVMPAAFQVYGMPVVEIRSMGTYNCRSRNNVPGARLSEHAFANAFDVGGFVLADGRLVTVKKGWRGEPADRTFLRVVQSAACDHFTTVLAPGSDGMHEDHFHLDLARHNAKGTSRYCRPKPSMPSPSPMPPTWQAGEEVPMASLPNTDWPKVLPQSVEAQRRADAAAGYDVPLPPAPLSTPMPGAVAPAGARVPVGTWNQAPGGVWTGSNAPLPPAAIPSVSSPAATGQTAPGCPPGYVCTPAPSAAPPLPPGWSVGPQPLQGYAPFGDPLGDLIEDDHTGALAPLDD